MKTFARLFFATVLIILVEYEKKFVQSVSFTAPLDVDNSCPPEFDKISNGCYSFSNYSSVSVTWTEARDRCNEMVNTTTGNFTGVQFHLLALESLGESISVYYFLKGGEYNHSFWIDTERHFGWDWQYDWSKHKFTSHGFLGDQGVYQTSTATQNHMFMKFNGSAYELYAANKMGDSTSNDKHIGYICEAQMPCQSTHDVCQNNGTCYTNSGKVLCICPPGYTGLLCEIVIRVCDSSPCLNGGNCSETINNYTCDCTGLFFEGRNCETEIPFENEEYRTITWAVSLGLLLGLIGFLCLMDFPLMAIIAKFNDKKDKFVNKQKAKKQARDLKKTLKEERKRQAEEIAIKKEAKKVATADIKPEQFLASEEEMLRRFRLALAASNKKSQPKKMNQNTEKNSGFDNLPQSSRMQEYRDHDDYVE